MKVIKKSSENEMVYEFLKAEILSDRFSDKIIKTLSDMKLDKDIILNGDIDNKEENVKRIEILRLYRGYGENRLLFENFPTEIDWAWAKFYKNDIDKIKYINYSYWNELSDYTGMPFEAAKNIKEGKTAFGVSNEGFLKAADNLEKGKKFPPVIMLTTDGKEFIILEGHLRMTAYALVPDLFSNVSALLGYCKENELKKWYGIMPKR